LNFLNIQKKICFCIIATFFICCNLFSFSNFSDEQKDSVKISCLLNPDSLIKKRLKYSLLTESALYATSIIALNQLWYKDYPQSKFHFFNDNAEWLLMDKIGHTFTSYQLGQLGYNVLKWSGVDEKKSVLCGGSLGSMFLTSVEVLDGFSDAWGFSTGDLLANTSGSMLFIGQQLLWEEQRISLKYSFSQSSYSNIRPDQLGENFLQNVIKDYNGQTYWLSCNIASFTKKENKFPKWLNIALGYGIDGVTGARENYLLNQTDRTTQYYLSLDIDLSKIPAKSPMLKTVLKSIGFLKFPAPTLELKKNGNSKLHGFYF
jgi:Predicted periplasmic lipoprotein (DUF2279)